MRWNGRGELVCPAFAGQSLESRLAAQRSVGRAFDGCDIERTMAIGRQNCDRDRRLRVAGAIALLCVVQGSCTSSEDRRFYEAFEAIPIGTEEGELIKLLGPADEAGKEFRLGQKQNFEEQYRAAAESASVRYKFWHRETDVVCAIGLDEQARLAYKACGGT